MAEPNPMPPGVAINGADAKLLATAIHDSVIQTATAMGVADDMAGCVRIAHALGTILRVWQNATTATDYGVLTAAFTAGFTSQITFAGEAGAEKQQPALRLIHSAGRA